MIRRQSSLPNWRSPRSTWNQGNPTASSISRLAARGAEVASDPSSSAAMTSAGDVHDEDAVRDAAAIAALLRARGTDFDAVW